MKYIAAYLLLVLGGTAAPSAKEVTDLLNHAGIEFDAERVKGLIETLKGKNVDELIAAGRGKLSTVSVGGAAAAGGAATAGGAAAAKEEVKEESDEEVGGVGGLFDDDDF